MRAVLIVLVALASCPIGQAFGQSTLDPDSCGSEVSDLAGLIDCRRLAEEGRGQRCAGSQQATILMPTPGRHVLRFGDKTQYGTTSKGVAIESEGQTVVAPSDGRVLFAGAYRTYGNLIIIDSCGFDILIAGVAIVATQAQELVKGGQTIGDSSRVGDVVYLEVRKANKAIDPFGPLSD